MDATVKQRVCGLLGGLSYVSTADVSYTMILDLVLITRFFFILKKSITIK